MSTSPAGWGTDARRWLRPAYLWRRLRHNFWQKLLSLLVAVSLWAVTTADRRANVEQGYDVPITVRDSTGGAASRAVSNLTPDTVRVTLSGRPERLRELRGANIEAVLDVTGVPEGGFNRPLTVSVPSGTTLARKSPERVQGFVDTQLSRTMPVIVAVATPPEDSLPRYTVSPSQVTVSGPSQVMSSVSRLVVSPVSLGAGEAREVPLLALTTAGQPVANLNVTPTTVTLRRIDSGAFPVKAVRVVLNDPPEGLIVTASSVQPSGVRVVAAPELLGRLQEVAGRVAYRPGTYTAPVTLNLPAGAQALENVSVSLTVQRAPQ
ncbi:YbbR-like domain-containing protein [Deinococcus fonticola]|uniref:CdaR family protein n=1 Tax=Deinococcus fonticola TaxID=2528713 RepID=UPI001074A227|nr:CdaR family protein [Deinococcus fonticola]